MIDSITTWMPAHQELLFWLAGLSAALFILSLASLPFLVARIPVDYFSDRERHQSRLRHPHPAAYYGVLLLKNLLGWILILAGVAMLLLPGQGLLTILMGLILSDFPGKFALERKLASNHRLFEAVNWLREKGNSPPLIAPAGCDGESKRDEAGERGI